MTAEPIALVQQHRIAVRDVAVLAERTRIIGVLLAEVGRRRLAGEREIADAIDALALQIEHPQW